MQEYKSKTYFFDNGKNIDLEEDAYKHGLSMGIIIGGLVFAITFLALL